MELKQIAPYLPYGLKISVDIYGQKSEIGILYGANNKQLELLEIRETITESFNYEFCKPILRSLSDLTKEIEHNGERFVPIEWLRKEYTGFYFESNPELMIKSKNTNLYISINWTNKFQEKLLEWKFDVFNQIGTFAIDANTLQTNPYK